MHIPPEVFWPYAGGGAALAMGIASHGKGLRQAQGFDRLILLGPVFMAVAMAVFGADHLTEPRLVAGVVPAWMPWRLFWAVFVGLALIAAAVSLATGIRARLAGALLGAMIFSFALLIYLPWWASAPWNRIRGTLLLRDLTLGWSCLAFAAGPVAFPAGKALPRNAASSARAGIVTIARRVVAVTFGVYAVEQFLNPHAAPGIPPDGPNVVTMPPWMPWHVAWAYVTGGIFVLSALALLTGIQARKAAVTLGTTVCVLIGTAYIPWTLAKASDVGDGLNYLAIHFALAGAVLLLAAVLPQHALSEPDREPAEPVLGTAQSWSE